LIGKNFSGANVQQFAAAHRARRSRGYAHGRQTHKQYEQEFTHHYLSGFRMKIASRE
jgi:hypothetical protein